MQPGDTQRRPPHGKAVLGIASTDYSKHSNSATEGGKASAFSSAPLAQSLARADAGHPAKLLCKPQTAAVGAIMRWSAQYILAAVIVNAVGWPARRPCGRHPSHNFTHHALAASPNFGAEPPPVARAAARHLWTRPAPCPDPCPAGCRRVPTAARSRGRRDEQRPSSAKSSERLW